MPTAAEPAPASAPPAGGPAGPAIGPSPAQPAGAPLGHAGNPTGVPIDTGALSSVPVAEEPELARQDPLRHEQGSVYEPSGTGTAGSVFTPQVGEDGTTSWAPEPIRDDLDLGGYTRSEIRDGEDIFVLYEPETGTMVEDHEGRDQASASVSTPAGADVTNGPAAAGADEAGASL